MRRTLAFVDVWEDTQELQMGSAETDGDTCPQSALIIAEDVVLVSDCPKPALWRRLLLWAITGWKWVDVDHAQ